MTNKMNSDVLFVHNTLTFVGGGGGPNWFEHTIPLKEHLIFTIYTHSPFTIYTLHTTYSTFYWSLCLDTCIVIRSTVGKLHEKQNVLNLQRHCMDLIFHLGVCLHSSKAKKSKQADNTPVTLWLTCQLSREKSIWSQQSLWTPCNQPICLCSTMCSFFFLGLGEGYTQWTIASPAQEEPLAGSSTLSAGKLLVECQLDSFNVVTQFDSWAQLQVHTFLNSGQVE